MATPSQIAANRRNAQKSTGPRSAAGKAASCFNALKHGIDARSQCIPSENRYSLDHLAAEYHGRFAPTTPEQRSLVDTLISCEWELRRYRAAGAQLWQLAAHKGIPDDEELTLADGFMWCQKTFMRLQRAIDSTHRNYHRALKTLQDLQSKGAGPAPQPAQQAPVTPQTANPTTPVPGPKLASFRNPAPMPLIPPENRAEGPNPPPASVPDSPAPAGLAPPQAPSSTEICSQPAVFHPHPGHSGSPRFGLTT